MGIILALALRFYHSTSFRSRMTQEIVRFFIYVIARSKATKQSLKRAVNIRALPQSGKPTAPSRREPFAGANIGFCVEIASLTLAILTFGSCTLAYAIVNIFRKMPLQASIYASIYECVRNQRLLG